MQLSRAARVMLASPVLLLGMAVVPSTASAASVTPVEVITSDPFAGTTPPDYRMSYALEQAELRALTDPAVYGQPYVDNGALVMPVVSQAAVAAASQPFSVPADLTQPDDGTDDTSVPPQDKETVGSPSEGLQEDLTPEQKAVPAPLDPTGIQIVPEVRIVNYSWSQLEAIKEDITTLTPSVLTDIDKIHATAIHPGRGQVIAEVFAAPDTLRADLAERYGSDALVLRVVDDPGPIEATSRQNDYSPFWGGAKIWTPGKCTSGFSWRYSAGHAMLSAGHCTTMNGTVSTNRESMGGVVKDTWWNGHGTVLIDGQTTYRGDLSLIKIGWGKASSPYIYVGGVDATGGRAVAGKWSRRAAPGDRYCAGGATTGETCGWAVNVTRMDVKYNENGVITWAKNVTRGIKQGQCIMDGDSGGPVYTVNSSGHVVAKGINSGKGGGGGDNWGGYWDPCHHFFTDIWDAYYALPGDVARIS